MNSNLTEAYLDESGSLPDRKEHFAVAVLINPKGLRVDRIIKKIRRKISKKESKKRRKVSELKFFNTSPQARRRVLELLNKEDIEIFVLILDKAGRQIADTPENYGKLINSLLEDCYHFYPGLDLKFDLHFNKIEERRRLKEIIQQEAKKHSFVSLQIEMLDSQKNRFLQLVDFIGGAFYYKYSRNDDFYTRLIKERVKVEKLIKWA